MSDYYNQLSGKPATGWNGNVYRNGGRFNSYTTKNKLSKNQRNRVKRSASKSRRRIDDWYIDRGMFSFHNSEELYSPSFLYWYNGDGYMSLTEDGGYIDHNDEHESMRFWINWALDMDDRGTEEHLEYLSKHETDTGWKFDVQQ